MKGLLNRSTGNDKAESNNLTKIHGLSREVEGMITSQKSMQSELNRIELNINEIKHLKPESAEISQRKLSDGVVIDPRIKRLEEQIDSLAKLIDTAKLQNVNYSGSLGSDTTTNSYDRYKFDTSSNIPNYKPLSQTYSVSRSTPLLQDEVLNSNATNLKYSDYLQKNQQQPWKTTSHQLNDVSSDKVENFLSKVGYLIINLIACSILLREGQMI